MGDSDSSESDSKPSKKHRRKKSRRRDDDSEDSGAKKRRRRHRDDDSIDDFSDRKDRRKSKKKRSKKHKKTKYDDSDSYDSSTSSDTSSRDNRRRKRKHKKKKSRKRDRKGEKQECDDGKPSFGKYGIIRNSDMSKMRRSFDVWLAEVQGVADFNGSRWELQEYFKTYVEDYNTATFPHKKYYNYDKWEMDEYQKQQKEGQAKASVSSVLQDQRQHDLEKRAQAKRARAEELEVTKKLMNREKVQEMKRQADLRAEMQIAYRTGDTKKYNRLKEKLEPSND